MTVAEPTLHTLWFYKPDGQKHQYSFHLGTIRAVALEEGEERAKSRLAKGEWKSAALWFGNLPVKVWLPEDFE